MKYRLAVIFVLVSVTFIYAQIDYDGCGLPQQAGKTCKTAKPSIRYAFDNKTKLCLAFKYNGCGGNKNKYKSPGDCQMCSGLGARRCPANTAKGASCSEDKDCKPTEYCNKGFNGGGDCCRKAAKTKFEADYNPKCGAGKKVVVVDEYNILMGKNCNAKFCPTGATCKNGTFFATCCKKA